MKTIHQRTHHVSETSFPAKRLMQFLRLAAVLFCAAPIWASTAHASPSSAAARLAGGAASAQAVSPELSKRIADSLRTVAPTAAIASIAPTAVSSLYEVVLQSGDLLYFDASGKYMISGQLIDVQRRSNITEARLAEINAIDFAALPLADALVHKKGSGERKLVVFADPNCGFCKKLERELENLENVTVYTLLLPVLGPDSVAKSHAIWCSKDKEIAWKDWMVKGVVPSAQNASCKAPLEKSAEIAKRHKIRGTPFIVFSDGKTAPGFVDSERLEGLMSRKK